MRTSLAIVSAVNDQSVFCRNLALSPLVANPETEVIVEEGHWCAGAAYNAGMSKTKAEMVAFCHQDVYLPLGWEKLVIQAGKALQQNRPDWAVLGVFGVKRSGEEIGRVWSSGIGRELGSHFDAPQNVVSVDELVIIVRPQFELQFDERLPGFHIYGTDIVQTALHRGLEAYVIHAPVIHNSNPVIQLDQAYWKAYAYLQAKWRAVLPIPTCVVPITRSSWQKWRYRISMAKSRLADNKSGKGRQDDPKQIAVKLGYEAA